MNILRRASGLLKDTNSIYVSKLSRRTALRNPELEAAVIKATSHDEWSLDYKNAQRVFTWIKTSPAHMRSLIWALSRRMERTRSWVVALKGLILMHGVICCKVPALQKIGRLPFDLANFSDGHSKPAKTWGFNAFVRAYFAFLDQRSAFLNGESLEGMEEDKELREEPMVQVLVSLQQLQVLLDLLLQIRPQADGMNNRLILEAMDCVIIEIFDVYSRICSGIAGVLLRIFSAQKVEAMMALNVLQKASSQGEELTLYFEFCREIGVINASEFPRVEKIPDEDIRDLERIIHGVSEKMSLESFNKDTAMEDDRILKESRSIHEEKKDSGGFMKTLVTDNWVVFEDDLKQVNISDAGKMASMDRFAGSVNPHPALNAYNGYLSNSNGMLRLANLIPGGPSTAEDHRNTFFTI